MYVVFLGVTLLGSSFRLFTKYHRAVCSKNKLASRAPLSSPLWVTLPPEVSNFGTVFKMSVDSCGLTTTGHQVWLRT